MPRVNTARMAQLNRLSRGRSEVIERCPFWSAGRHAPGHRPGVEVDVRASRPDVAGDRTGVDRRAGRGRVDIDVAGDGSYGRLGAGELRNPDTAGGRTQKR